ncbi:hypothetical protein SK066_10980 [Paenibacillus hunanensis]|uniref:hypothetical protein n=1 Tax=Paenibacillus hunanensis TaxID=539262 RepID=UPI002A6B51FF|nr:hypothetical protein [Paenibacillus hunanensis]WPP43420.1 hypothetical protein SK066_10980 [Paenibacillus hunanensis]
MNDLHHTFSELEQDVQHTLHETESMKHPLIELIRYSLHEQQQALSRLLPLLKSAALSTVEGDKPPRDDLQSLDAIKPYVTLLYQNQEVSEPTVRAWVRAVQWIPSFETEASGDIQARFNDMHHRLELAGTLLVRLYGQKPLKFVIPAAYTETEVKA